MIFSPSSYVDAVDCGVTARLALKTLILMGLISKRSASFIFICLFLFRGYWALGWNSFCLSLTSLYHHKFLVDHQNRQFRMMMKRQR